MTSSLRSSLSADAKKFRFMWINCNFVITVGLPTVMTNTVWFTICVWSNTGVSKEVCKCVQINEHISTVNRFKISGVLQFMVLYWSSWKGVTFLAHPVQTQRIYVKNFYIMNQYLHLARNHHYHTEQHQEIVPENAYTNTQMANVQL